ncbi:Transposable element Hobo transposase, partial [Nosema granulosis]
MQTTTCVVQPKFAYNKKVLPEKYKLKLKDAELKFVVAGSHSFNSLENDGLLTLIQTGIEIGANFGLVDIHDIFYGRQSIREDALSKLAQYTHQIRSLLEEPIKQHCIAATTDLWTDDLMKRSYLDFTVFFVNDAYELKHSLLRCKHFDEAKTGINIWHEIEQFFESFNLSFGDTPITTDQGSNMIKALSLADEASYPCLAHRTNTVLETAWDSVKKDNIEFKNFCTSINDLRNYCQQSGGIQFKLPKTLKSTSGTRPWRSYFLIHDSLHQSYDQLLMLLRERSEQHCLVHINPLLLSEISKFMEN